MRFSLFGVWACVVSASALSSGLQGVADTCRKTVAYRAISHLLPVDPVAALLAGEDKIAEVKALVASMPSPAVAQNLREMFAVRSEWINREVQRHMMDSEDITQVLILGAGMDTRAYTLQCLKGVHVYEVDLPEVVILKERLLRRLKDKRVIARSVSRVAADLTAAPAEWLPRLYSLGYNPDCRTIIILEGLLYYLSVEQGDSLLRLCFTAAAPRSVVIADTMSSGFDPATECEATPYIRKHVMDHPNKYMCKLGFKHVQVAQPGKEANFGMLDTTVSAGILGDVWPCLYPIEQTVDKHGKKICRFFLVSSVTPANWWKSLKIAKRQWDELFATIP